MRHKAIIIMAVITLCIINLQVVSAEERPIYVGDIIELSIDSQVYSLPEIELAFEDFEIIDISQQEDVYLIKIRSFDIGEHQVNLGNSEIMIHIASLLLDDKTELLPADLEIDKPWPIVPWTVIKYIAMIIILSCVVLLIILKFKNRTKKPLSNYQRFKIDIEALKTTNDDYANGLTHIFMDYTAKQLDKNLQGLTSQECLSVVKDLSQVEESYDFLCLWLNKCDVFKYSKDKANEEAKLKLKKELLAIVESIEKHSEVIV